MQYIHIYIYICVRHTSFKLHFFTTHPSLNIDHLDSQGPLGFGFRVDSERSEGGGINDWDEGRYLKVNFDEGRSTKGWYFPVGSSCFP